MNPIFKEFNKLINQVQLLFNLKEYNPIRTGVQLQANIVFSDLKKNNSIVLYITNSTQKVYRGFYSSAGLSFIGSSSVWNDILKDKKSLTTAFAEGKISVPNLRVNWSKLWMLSYIIKNVNNFN